MKRNILIFILGVLCTIIVGVGASAVYNAKDIAYSNSKTTATNVSDAIDELIEDNNKELTFVLKAESNGTTVSAGTVVFTSDFIESKFSKFKITDVEKYGNSNFCQIYAWSKLNSDYYNISANTEYNVNDSSDEFQYQTVQLRSISSSSTWGSCEALITFYN